MSEHRLFGHVNEQHELVVRVPASVPPGPVEVLIVSESDACNSEADWDFVVVDSWAEELSDTRQDIYTLDDGEPVDAT